MFRTTCLKNKNLTISLESETNEYKMSVEGHWLEGVKGTGVTFMCGHMKR